MKKLSPKKPSQVCFFLYESKILIYLETFKICAVMNSDKGRTLTKLNGHGAIILRFETALCSQGLGFDSVCCLLFRDSLQAVNCLEKKRWWWWQMGHSNKANNHGEWGWLPSLGELEHYPWLIEHQIKGWVKSSRHNSICLPRASLCTPQVPV